MPGRGREAAARPHSSRATATEGRRRRDVVVEVAEEPLEPGVEIGGEGDHEQVDVELVELEARGQLTEPQPAPAASAVSAACSHAASGSWRSDQSLSRRNAGEQPVDHLVAEVEAAERIVGLRDRPRGGPPRARRIRSSIDAEPPQQVRDAAGRRSRRLPLSVLVAVARRRRSPAAVERVRAGAPSRRCRSVDEVGHVDVHAVGDRRARREDEPGATGAVTTRSSDGFSSPPSDDHTSANARSSGGGRATVSGTAARSRRASP